MLKEKKEKSKSNGEVSLSGLSNGDKIGLIRFISKYLTNFQNLVEIINLIRPLAYLGFLMYFKQKSYVPIIASLILDLIVLKFYRKEEKFIQQKIFSYEYSSRLFSFYFIYFLREPIYSKFTKPFLRTILSKMWLSSWIVEFLLNLLTYFTNFYYIL